MQHLEKLIDDLIHKRIALTTGFALAKKLNNQFKDESLTTFINNESVGYYEISIENYPLYRIKPTKKMFVIANPMNGVQQTINLDIPFFTKLPNGKKTELKYIAQSVSEIEFLIKDVKNKNLVIDFSGRQIAYSNRFFQDNFSHEGWGVIKGTFEFTRAQFEGIYQSILDRLIEELMRIQSIYPAINPTSKLYSKGSYFDSTLEVSKILKSAAAELIIIDNYIDENVLNLLTDVKQTVKIKFLTNESKIKKSFSTHFQAYDKQFNNLEIKYTSNFHDRFIIVDKCYYYQCGASLKDLGNRVFMFVKIEQPSTQSDLINQFNIAWK